MRSAQRPTTAVLKNGGEAASAEVAYALALPEGTAVTVLARLRSAQGQPIAHLVNYLPPTIDAVSTEALERSGLYQVLRARGVYLHAARQTIGARNATAAEARMLGETRGSALLTMQRITYDDHGQAIEFGTHIYCASRYSFEQGLLAR